jgi:hypothetical protein
MHSPQDTGEPAAWRQLRQAIARDYVQTLPLVMTVQDVADRLGRTPRSRQRVVDSLAAEFAGTERTLVFPAEDVELFASALPMNLPAPRMTSRHRGGRAESE